MGDHRGGIFADDAGSFGQSVRLARSGVGRFGAYCEGTALLAAFGVVCTADGAGGSGWSVAARSGVGMAWAWRWGTTFFGTCLCFRTQAALWCRELLPGSAGFRGARSCFGGCRKVLAAWRGGVVCTADGAGVPGGLWAARSGVGMAWAWRWGTAFFGTCLCFRMQAALWCRELLPGSAVFRAARSRVGACKEVLAAFGVVCTADGAGVPGGLWRRGPGGKAAGGVVRGARKVGTAVLLPRRLPGAGLRSACPGRETGPSGSFGRRTRGFCRRGNRKGAGTQKVCTFLQRKSGFLLNFFAKSDTIILYSFKARDFTESTAFRI